MKRLVLLFLAALPGLLHSQSADSLQGVVRYLITHNWTKKLAAVEYISKQKRERAAYVWGSRAEWKMYANLYFKATETKYEDSEERAEPDDEGYSWQKDVFVVRRNFEKQTINDAIQALGKVYIIEDSLRCQNWKIQNDLKEVAGHLCMRATTEDTLKMQKIEAWFALDIPLSGGPERFCGLPGLILEVNVNNGGMVVSADKIDLRPLGKELDLPKKQKGKRVKEADYTEVLRKFIDDRKKEDEAPFWGIRY